eukprot:1158825-Pelagomonas_calceolata.AAC.3
MPCLLGSFSAPEANAEGQRSLDFLRLQGSGSGPACLLTQGATIPLQILPTIVASLEIYSVLNAW